MKMLSYGVDLASPLDPVFIGKRILIAEDEPLIALDLEDMLTRMGFAVSSARDVASSLECIVSHPIDAAVLDVQLGRETIQPVADALTKASIPFLLTTGLEAGSSYPGAPFLQKPYSFEQIKDGMARLLATPPTIPAN